MPIALSIILGLVVVVWGADVLVRGASQLALAAGLSPLVVGLTVVAFGTSAPELAVSLRAAWIGEAGVGLGNVFGSNIANILLILGVSAAITPLAVSRQLVRIEVPLMVLVTAVACGLAYDAQYSRGDGLLLGAGLLGYLLLQAYWGKNVIPQIQSDTPEEIPATGKLASLARVALGLVMLVGGAHLLVDGAVRAATLLGVSEVLIGLTVVAIGTSLPEIVTSIVASIRGERDLAVGNVVGSNMFNLMGVLGISAIISPTMIPVSDSLKSFDIPVTFMVAALCLPIFITGRSISRLEGFFLLALYFAYLSTQIVSALH